MLAKVTAVQDRLGAMVDALAAAIGKANPVSHPPPQSPQLASPSHPPRQVIHRPSTRPAPPAAVGGAPALGNSGKRRMLIALAQHPEGLTDRKLSILTGIAKKGGTWRTHMGELRGLELIEGRGELRASEDLFT